MGFILTCFLVHLGSKWMIKIIHLIFSADFRDKLLSFFVKFSYSNVSSLKWHHLNSQFRVNFKIIYLLLLGLYNFSRKLIFFHKHVLQKINWVWKTGNFKIPRRYRPMYSLQGWGFFERKNRFWEIDFKIKKSKSKSIFPIKIEKNRKSIFFIQQDLV